MLVIGIILGNLSFLSEAAGDFSFQSEAIPKVSSLSDAASDFSSPSEAEPISFKVSYNYFLIAPWSTLLI